MKTCSKCKIEKSIECFSKDKNRKVGIYPRCKDCCATYRLSVTKESRKQYNDKYIKSDKGKEVRHTYSISDKKKQQDKQYIKTEAGKNTRKIAQKTYFLNHPNLEDLRAIRSYITFVIKPSILERDNYSCQLCKINRNLVIHHVIPVKIDPSQILNPANLITLCKNCHKKAHNGSWHDLNKTIALHLTHLIKEI